MRFRRYVPPPKATPAQQRAVDEIAAAVRAKREEAAARAKIDYPECGICGRIARKTGELSDGTAVCAACCERAEGG